MKTLVSPFKVIKYYFQTRRKIRKVKSGTDFKDLRVDEKAQVFAYTSHYNVLQFYNTKLYYYHIDMVAKYAKKYSFLLKGQSKYAIAMAYLHDTIEDCRLTYNDIKKVFGYKIAEGVYALTNDKGKNRAQRAGDAYYAGLKANELAHFVKICDRLANVEHSKATGSSMFYKYKKENELFYTKLYDPKFETLFKELDKLFYD